MNSKADDRRISGPTEIRLGERIETDVPVTLEAGNGMTGTGVMRDISISGALIETELVLPVLTHVVVSLPPMGEATPECKLSACVVRHAILGIAIEWRDMASTSLLAVLCTIRRGSL